MGAGMARNIERAGMPLRVWNRTRERAEPLAADGALISADPRSAVEGADVVLTMLWDADTVESALRQAVGGFAPGTVLLQQSTVGVEGAERLAEVATELGLAYVDAPVLGTKAPAEQGTLVVLASGPDEERARVQPVLDAIGSRTLWLGPAGSRLKLAANAFVITLVAGIAQSVALTARLGLDPARFLEAVGGEAMDAPYVQLKGHTMIAGDFAPAFGLAGALKDADLIHHPRRRPTGPAAKRRRGRARRRGPVCGLPRVRHAQLIRRSSQRQRPSGGAP